MFPGCHICKVSNRTLSGETFCILEKHLPSFIKFCALSNLLQGRNMVYSGPIDPYFLADILIPEPHFPQNLDP